ncbi:ABC transporter permease [Candidatus Methylopumilus rimovensis]|jgi:cell division transport system permease protein|uniref:Cell division protein FtsX n=1 Tax=Candidatus Methylopumilus rimovensis TaxID=2588535 RepID=A0AAE6FSJ4_9PROT|nr:permease-like cell division protein FtsX [Candidatus Methylopumilus rimovensis]QDD13233.1 ABC transporter permease [Candidatus Methylopumilus rimovensis]
MNYFVSHYQILLKALQRSHASMLSTLMMFLVIGVTLILPSISFLVVQNLKSISETIQHESQITIFLKKDISADAKNKIEKELKSRIEINNYHYVKKEEAWPKLQKSMGFNESNNGLSDNPLPDAFFVSPNSVNPNQIVILKSSLDRLEGVDQVVVDTGWVKKLNSLLHLANKAIFLASILLASMLTMVIGNTIRLQMTSHHEEIELSKLIGATNQFIRRPFLYSGFIYGLGGGLTAALSLKLIVIFLNQTVVEVEALYGTQFIIIDLTLLQYLSIVGSSILIAVAASFISINQSIKKLMTT